MGSVIEALQAEISKDQQQIDSLTAHRDGLKQMLEQARRFGMSTALTGAASVVEPGAYKGMKPAQAIAALLKSRGNSGMSRDDIVEILTAEGYVFKGKKYPKRAVALTLANSDLFEEKESLVYLKPEQGCGS